MVEAASRRGRRPAPSRDHRAPVLEALQAVATRLLALRTVPVRRRAVQDELVCAFDRGYFALALAWMSLSRNR